MQKEPFMSMFKKIVAPLFHEIQDLGQLSAWLRKITRGSLGEWIDKLTGKDT
jgi:hypothetical protein